MLLICFSINYVWESLLMLFIKVLLLLNITVGLQAQKFIERINKFVSSLTKPAIDYSSIIYLIRQYSTAKLLLPTAWKNFNTYFWALYYIDLARPKHKFNIRQSDTSQTGICDAQNNLYEEWFLNKDSFFIPRLRTISLLKDTYLDKANSTSMLEGLPFANEYIVPSIQESTERIAKEFNAKKIAAKAIVQQNVLQEHNQASQEILQKLNQQKNQIEQKRVPIQKKVEQLQQEAAGLQSLLANLQEDLTLLKTIEKVKQNNNIERQDLSNKYQNQESDIQNKINILKQEIEKNEKLKNNLSKRLANTGPYKDLLNEIEEYNKEKQQQLDEQQKQSVTTLPKELSFESVKSFAASVAGLEPADLKKKREVLEDKIKKTGAKVQILNDNLLFTQELQNLIKTNIDNAKIKAYDEKITTAEKELKNLQMLLVKIKDTFEKNQATLESRITELQKQIKNKKFDLFSRQKPIDFLENEIKKTEENIAAHQVDLNNAATELKDINLEIQPIDGLINQQQTQNGPEQSAIQRKIEELETEQIAVIKKKEKQALENIDVLKAAKDYVKSIIALYNQQTLHKTNLKTDIQKITPKNNPSVCYVPQKMQLLLYDLALIADVPNTLTEKIEQKSEFCSIDDSALNNIQIKIAFLKEDIASMIQHTLSIAQTVESDYQKLIAIKELFFIPLCNVYEQIDKAVEPLMHQVQQQKSDPFDLQAIKKEYPNVEIFKQSIDNSKLFSQETLGLAERFFEKVFALLETEINQIVPEDFKIIDEQDTWDKVKEIIQYMFVLKAIGSTQIRWYPSKTLKTLFTSCEKKLLNQKIKIAHAMLSQNNTPTINNAQPIIEAKNKTLQGQLIDAINQLVHEKQLMITLDVLFSKKSRQVNTTGIFLKDILKTRFEKTIKYTDPMMRQVIATIEKDLQKHISAVLKKLPDEYSQTNPFVETPKPESPNPFDNHN